MHRRVDIAFVIDTTGSMGSFLNSAKRQVLDMLNRVRAAADTDVRCVLIDYRDHPPEDPAYPAFLQTGKDPVTPEAFQRVLQGLGLGSGGDSAESVFDGLDMLTEVTWRPHSRRIAFLVGDAPGHGYYKIAGRQYGWGSDHWPDGCPCGKTAESVSANLEELGITLYGVVVSNEDAAKQCFGEVARLTGGSIVTGTGMRDIENYLKEEFGQLDFDKRVLDAVLADESWSVHGLASEMGAPEGDVDSSVRRLLCRDLIPVPAAA